MEANESADVILVIEDDFDIRTLISMTLKRSGFQVVAVETGEEGLKQAKILQPLVITLGSKPRSNTLSVALMVSSQFVWVQRDLLRQKRITTRSF